MLAILRFRASKLGAEGSRPRLAAAYVIGHLPHHEVLFTAQMR
jgi:hypothetical protein